MPSELESKILQVRAMNQCVDMSIGGWLYLLLFLFFVCFSSSFLSEIQLKTPSALSLQPLLDHSPLVLTKSHGTVSWAILLFMAISTSQNSMRSTLPGLREISVALRAMQCQTTSKQQMQITPSISQSIRQVTFRPMESLNYTILRYDDDDNNDNDRAEILT